MKNIANSQSILFIVVSLFIFVSLFILILEWGRFLIVSGYIVEKFDTSSSDYGNPKFSHTVDLPLTTTYTCRNMCSSQSKCYLTGGNCTSDIDCFGCNPYGENRNQDLF